jgi:hypothetical protein
MKDKYYYSDDTTSSEHNRFKTLHREDGPAVEDVGGYRAWYMDGQYHREDGPAVECVDGYKEWWLYGKWHREDGPAIEHTNGDKDWYANGQYLATLTKEHLIRYMETYNLTIAHLLTDSDEIVRTSAAKYDWKKVV